MYDRETGLNRLHELKNSLIDSGEYDYEAIATVSVKFDLFGRNGVEVRDLDVFHEAQRIAILRSAEASTKYQLDIRCKAIPRQEDPNDMDQIGKAIAKGYSQARIVLAGLAASSSCLILRRHLTFLHDATDVAIRGRPDLSRVEFEHGFPIIESDGTIHAGNLCAAITALAMFNTSWSEAFLHNYECGQMFLLSPMEFNLYTSADFLTFYPRLIFHSFVVSNILLWLKFLESVVNLRDTIYVEHLIGLTVDLQMVMRLRSIF